MAGAAPEARRAGLVLVVPDDVGFAHLRCYGSTIETPNIDALAAPGAILCWRALD